jgi:hypothetical protein
MNAATEFRPHRPVDPEQTFAQLLTRNFVRMFRTQPSDADLSAYRAELVGPDGTVITVLARWGAAAMLCPYMGEGEVGASYCGASRCRHWADDGEGYGTCARAEA